MADILVVDDEVTIREPLRGLIESLGHSVTEAGDGLEALTLLTQRDFDLVLTDVMMPRMNGFQLLERALPYLRERTPMLILSSMADEEGVEAAMFAGAFDYMLKPCDPDRAERILSDALTQRRAWLERLGPYRAKGAPVPASVLLDRPVAAERVQAKIPLSGASALKPRRGVISVPDPKAQTHAHTPPGEPGGVWQRLRALFGGKQKAA